MKHIDKCDEYDFDPARKRIGQSDNPTATVPHGVAMLDRAWSEVSKLFLPHARDNASLSYNRGINQALSIIESLGGRAHE